ncbi:MAG TPA: YceI family protein [Candidatus Acidoferrum sp.]|jgi:polyisoprenoid-binding protein YceI
MEQVMDAGTQRGLTSLNFQIDLAASRITVQAFATGLLSAFGHNPRISIRDYDGEIEFIPETYEKAFVKITVQMRAMEVLDEMKNDDRRKLENDMYHNVLDVDRFPTAVFESKQIMVQKLSNDLVQAHVVGELSFHGVTRAETIDARVTNMGTMLRASGEFTLRQSDYGIKPISFAAGALRLKDELKFRFELVARQQE